jgi:hypothetical protein
MQLYLEQTMDKLQLECQSRSAIGIGSGICDGMEVVLVVVVVVVVMVVGSGIVSGSSDSNTPTQLLLIHDSSVYSETKNLLVPKYRPPYLFLCRVYRKNSTLIIEGVKEVLVIGSQLGPEKHKFKRSPFKPGISACKK